MRRSIFFLLLHIFLLLQLTLFAQSYHVRIPELKISSQETYITLPILVNENLAGQEIYAYTLHLSWDHPILQNPTVNLAGCLAEIWGTENLVQNSPAPGQLIISHHAASPALSGTGALLKLTFQVAGKAGSNSPVNIDLLILNTIKAIVTPGRIIINNPPSASGLKISPESVRTTDDLNSNYSFYDPDNDPEDSTLIQWYKDGKLQSAFNQRQKISANFTRKGERWYLTIQPHDGIEFGKKVQSAEIIILNTPPTVQNVQIKPAQPVDTDTLYATYQFLDVDDDLENSSEIKWYKNNQMMTTFSNILKIPPTAFKNGDTWYFTISPKDGEAFGQSEKSPTVTIGVSNYPPEARNLSIIPANPRTDDMLTGAYQYSDLENEPEKNSEIEWYKNNQVQVAIKNQLQVPPDVTTKNETWYFTVKPSDGKSFGLTGKSPIVLIQNTPPMASNLQVLPAVPTILDSLTAKYLYTDVDQDLESGTQIRWYKNGALQSEYNNRKIIPVTALKINDSWHFTIEPDDGTTRGDIVTSKKVVVQGIPSQVNFVAEPTTGTEPLSVQFRDLSQGMINTWFWDFGDGQTSLEQNPVHIYHANNLPYSVKLIVGGPAGLDSLTKEYMITVIPALKAGLQALPIVGKSGLNVNFTNMTTGGALFLKWFWGDGTQTTTFGVSSGVSHTYQQPGCHSVALKANGQSVVDSVYYKDLIYIDNDFIPLKLVGSGNGLKGTSWANIIDQNVFNDSGKVISTLEDAWAIFQCRDGVVRKLNDLRIKRANYFSTVHSKHLAKKFEIYVTEADDFGNDLKRVLEANLATNDWQIVSFPDNVLARFVVIKILASEEVSQDTCELAEFQLFGVPDETSTEDESIPAIKPPFATHLSPNFPNPFNPETKIQYQLAEEGLISIYIFNLNGKKIRTLKQENQKSGTYQIQWDGQDDWGNSVSSGIYFCRLAFLNKKNKMMHQTRKISFIK